MSKRKPYDVVVLDDAMIDEFYHAGDEHLNAHKLPKGETTPTDDNRAIDRAAEGCTPLLRLSGGGGANTAAGVSLLGGKSVFAGKTGAGPHGKFYRQHLSESGVALHDIPCDSDRATGRVAVFINPQDQERTMMSIQPQGSLTAEDIPHDLLKRTKTLFVQGYSWMNEASRPAFRAAFDTVHRAGGKVAFTLAAPFCVHCDREGLQQLVEKDDGIDILFANEKEIAALYPDRSFDEICRHLETISARGKTIALTLSEKGSILFHHGLRHDVGIVPVNKVDLTGAGDNYAAGILFGLTHGMDIAECGKLGATMASKVIGHLGARITREDAPNMTAVHSRRGIRVID